MIPGFVAAVQEGGHVMGRGAVLPQATSARWSVVWHDSRCSRGAATRGPLFHCQPPALRPSPDMPAP